MILDILTHPNENLRKKSSVVDKKELKSEKFQSFLNDLGETMLQEDGAGLAAPQVDVRKRVVAINMDGCGRPEYFINPRIVRKSLVKSIVEEGCLSIPDVFGNVKRPKTVWIKYMDKDGNEHKVKGDDYLSRVIQHELDHLEGILFIDKVIK